MICMYRRRRISVGLALLEQCPYLTNFHEAVNLYHMPSHQIYKQYLKNILLRGHQLKTNKNDHHWMPLLCVKISTEASLRDDPLRC